MNISVITTVRHNIGDDFVREGIIHLVGSALARSRGSESIEIELIHKHSPVTAVYGLEWIRSMKLSRLMEPASRLIRVPDRIDAADFLIQSGAPIYWCHPNGSHCSDNEWFDPLIRKRFRQKRKDRRFLNIAGGSCQRYHSDGSELNQCGKCKAYIAEFYDTCDLTTLRDDLARKMLGMTGRDAPVLPCTSIFARDRLGIEPAEGEYIVLNFMERGGHFTFGQTIDKEKWRRKFKAIACAVEKMGPVVMACHNTRELDLASEIVPQIRAFLIPRDHTAFMRFYARARFGIVNRVHSAFMMASFGKPSAVIGADSRARMMNMLKLPSYFVEEIENEAAIVESIAALEHSYGDVIADIRRKAAGEYISLVSNAL